LFKFGSGRSAGGTIVGGAKQPGFLLFNSRTIGIKEGQRIPLYGGAKITGKVGRYSLGVMNLQSERSVLDDGTVELSTNFTAMKFKRDLGTNSNVGFMVLNKQAGPGNYSRAVGSDAFFAFSPEFTVNASLAKTFSPGLGGPEWAGEAGLVLNKDWLDASVNYTHIDTLFNPEMGFVARGNIRSVDGLVSFTGWLNNDYLKNVSLVNRLVYTTDHHNTLQTRLGNAELWVTTRSEDFFSLGVSREYDFLPVADYIRDIMIGQGAYSVTRRYVSFKSFRARPIVCSVAYNWGERFDSKSRDLSLTGRAMVTSDLNVDLVYTHDNLELKNGSLNANLLVLRLTYSFSTELFAKYYVQYNDTDHHLSTNLLIDYIYRPRSHVYLVFNENRDRLNRGGGLRDRVLLMKFTYLWNLWGSRGRLICRGMFPGE